MARKASSKPDSGASQSTATIGFEADLGPAHANTFRRDLLADHVPATAESDSAYLNAKPHRRACQRQDNPMPFNDSDTALRDSAFLQSEAKMQVVSEAKDNFRNDDDMRWQPSGARQIAKGNPQAEGGGVHQFGVPPKGNANFAWVQHFIHHLAPQGMAGFVLANGSMSSNQSGEGDMRTIFQHRFCQTSYASIAA
jgi:hypothetical protein